jgi:hypothetical protein
MNELHEIGGSTMTWKETSAWMLLLPITSTGEKDLAGKDPLATLEHTSMRSFVNDLAWRSRIESRLTLTDDK